MGSLKSFVGWERDQTILRPYRVDKVSDLPWGNSNSGGVLSHLWGQLGRRTWPPPWEWAEVKPRYYLWVGPLRREIPGLEARGIPEQPRRLERRINPEEHLKLVVRVVEVVPTRNHTGLEVSSPPWAASGDHNVPKQANLQGQATPWSMCEGAGSPPRSSSEPKTWAAGYGDEPQYLGGGPHAGSPVLWAFGHLWGSGL